MLLSSATSTPRANYGFRPVATPDAALIDIHGRGFFTVADSFTGYGRHEGYGSQADAMRAAFQLSRGAESPAAAVYRAGSRFYVRAVIAGPGTSPHDGNAPKPPNAPAQPTPLHFEGAHDPHFAWVRDPRLVALVDGATKFLARDAHHAPPK